MDADPDPDFTRWPGLVERPGRGSGESSTDGVSRRVEVVLIHGTMDRGAGMAHLARQLRDLPTLRYDRRGYGRAVRLVPGHLVRQVDDLIGIVGKRPVVLFGHSFGGLVALGATATGRLDVRGLVTWEVPTPWLADWPGWVLSGTADAEDPTGAAAEAFMRATIGQDRFEALPARTRRARRAEGLALQADLDPLLRAGVPFDPERVAVPCLFGAGTVSRAPYVLGAEWLAAHVPNGRVTVFDGAAHGAPMDRAPQVAGLIRQVVDEVTDADPGPAEPVVDAGEEDDAFAV